MMELDQKAHVPPIVICFLIECRCTAQPGVNIWPGGWDSPAGRETRQWLQSEGLVDDQYCPTERGNRWLDAILSVPLPGSTVASLLSDDEVGLIERLREDADEIEACGGGNEAGRIREAAALLQSQAAELAAANERVTTAVDDYNDALGRAERAEAALAEARKALEPFAAIADTEDEVGREDPDDDRVWVVQAHGCQIGDLTVEHFRAARRAHSKDGGEHDRAISSDER